MCGRYVNISKLKAIEKRFNATAKDEGQYQINANICPGQKAPVVLFDEGRMIDFMTFGFTPSWSQKPMYLINARAEGDHNKENNPQYTGGMGIIQKPAYRKAIRSQRCLVIADAFVEGPEKEKLSKPYLIYMKDKSRKPFALAGIWESWVNRETGEEHRGFSIITTTANELLQTIGHHRMPVILDPSSEDLWMDPNTDLGVITALLLPYPAGEMNAYPIDPAIKSPRNHETHLLMPTGERVFPEYDYILAEELKLEGMGHTQARQRKNEEGEQGKLF